MAAPPFVLPVPPKEDSSAEDGVCPCDDFDDTLEESIPSAVFEVPVRFCGDMVLFCRLFRVGAFFMIRNCTSHGVSLDREKRLFRFCSKAFFSSCFLSLFDLGETIVWILFRSHCHLVCEKAQQDHTSFFP